MRTVTVGTNVIYYGTPLNKLQVVSGVGVRFLGGLGLMAGSPLPIRGEMEQGLRQAGTSTSNPVLHPPLT